MARHSKASESAAVCVSLSVAGVVADVKPVKKHALASKNDRENRREARVLGSASAKKMPKNVLGREWQSSIAGAPLCLSSPFHWLLDRRSLQPLIRCL